MNRRIAALSILAALAIGFVLVQTDGAEAIGDYSNDFLAEYPSAGSLATCSTCHTSAPSLNPYGAALQANNLNFAAVANLDSDGDGFTNAEEIAALTNPGASSSAPTTTTVATTPSTTAPTTPSPSTASTTAGGSTSTTSSTIATAAAAVTDSGSIDFPMEFTVGDAGTVVIDLVDGKLIATVAASDGWSFEIESDEHGEIEVEFENGEMEIEFEAEFEEGELKVKVEEEIDDDDDHDADDDHDDDDHDDDHDDDDDDDDDHDDD